MREGSFDQPSTAPSGAEGYSPPGCRLPIKKKSLGAATMPAQKSAGLLAYRRRRDGVEFLLVHPGGPFWTKKDEGAWSLPKGLIDEGEETFAAAAREFEEEVGQPIAGCPQALTPRGQPSGKRIYCWMLEADLDLSMFRSNTFEMEWPPKTGLRRTFPEVDRVAYLPAAVALRRIHPGQRPILEEALSRLGVGATPASPQSPTLAPSEQTHQVPLREN
jgi:predicted NUDIX family NTP pyrophosphohydrolase